MAKNRLQFQGNVTRPAEVKTYEYQGKTTTYTSLPVALNHPRNRDAVKFFDCQFYDKFGAEVAAKLEKGQSVIVEGEFMWAEGKKGEIYKLGNASFVPGWLPPKKEGSTSAPASSAQATPAIPESDDLDF